jgi:hypothetical protein
MMSAARRRHDGRRPLRAAITTAVALVAPLLWLTVVPCTAAQGAALPTTAVHSTTAGGAAPAHDSGHGPRQAEGPVAKAASVLGIIIIVVCIVGLGSLSVRRRTRDRPPNENPARGGPPGRERGLFDEWFRPRR